MSRMTLLLAAALVTALACAGVVWAQETTRSAPQQDPAGNVIPGRYIVVLKEGARDPTAVARQHAQRYGAQVLYTYQHAIKGYAARIPDQRLDKVRSDPRVDYVEADETVEIAAQTLPWGIDRVEADISSTLAGNGKADFGTNPDGTPRDVRNVNAYILDSGIYKHPDLNVVKHVNFRGDGKNYDCDGHGTHVAGTVAAKDNTGYVVGVVPGAPLTGVKVLGCTGTGSWSGVIKGVDWVTANAVKPAIANMSLSGGANQAADTAVQNSAASGIFYSIAAGNSGADACNYSPARVGAGTDNGIATVAATTSSDVERTSSNYGECVDIWAPGEGILSTRRGGGTTTMSGTSMAAPHVGGGGALYLSSNTAASSDAVESALTSSVTTTANTSKDGATIVLENVSGF